VTVTVPLADPARSSVTAPVFSPVIEAPSLAPVIVMVTVLLLLPSTLVTVKLSVSFAPCGSALTVALLSSSL
jgi:hypothetical protein